MCRQANSRAEFFAMLIDVGSSSQAGSTSTMCRHREVAPAPSESEMTLADMTSVPTTLRTVGHTSTTRLGTTMTTDVRYGYVEDVSSNNDVLCIATDSALKLAAGVWTKPVVGPRSNANTECLQHVFT